MMVRYLLDADARVASPGVAAPESEFDDVVAPVALALEQREACVRPDRGADGRGARGERLLSEQFVQWFLRAGRGVRRFLAAVRN